MEYRRRLLRTLIQCIIVFNVSLAITAQNKHIEYILPKSYINGDSIENISQKLPIEELWWKDFQDPVLDSLMNVAMGNNWDLLIAQSRILQSRAAMRSAYGELLPNIGIQTQWQRMRTSDRMKTVALQKGYTSYYTGVANMSWEIDLFGNIWQKARSQKNLYKASKADYNATMVSLAASLGSAYINLRTTQGLLEVTDANIVSQLEILKITQARYDAGLSSLLDVAQAKSTYYNTRASISTIKASQIEYINAVAVLCGVLPSAVSPVLLLSAPFPVAERLVPVSIPANLLRQRPDIVAAEYTVNSQAALLGAAKAQWLPSFFINGEIGFSAPEINELFSKKSFLWQVEPVMKWTLFNGGQRVAAVSSAKAALQSSIDSYNLTVLTALQEVENAISSYSNGVLQVQELKTAVFEAQNSLKLSVELYKMGLSAFINVVNAQQTLLSYQTSLVSSQGKCLLDLIALYQALGGGWVE